LINDKHYKKQKLVVKTSSLCLSKESIV